MSRHKYNGRYTDPPIGVGVNIRVELRLGLWLGFGMTLGLWLLEDKGHVTAALVTRLCRTM